MTTTVERVFDERDMMGFFLLPDEVSIDIFLRLPIKKLAQLRCVCKTWNQMITSKSFVRFHFNQSITKSCILYRPYLFRPLELGMYSEPDEDDLDPEPSQLVKLSNPPFAADLMEWNIVGSCNGVLCLWSNVDKSLIYMWNPSINNYIALPRPYSCDIRHVGFGVNRSSGDLDDFKVVIISANANAEVYSLRNNSWISVVGGLPPSIEISCFPHEHPVFTKGCVHWLARVSVYQDTRCRWHIIAFDFATEVFKKIMLPDILSNYDGTMILNNLRGRLCVFVAFDDYSFYQLWAMPEYEIVDFWCRLYEMEKHEYWWPLGFSRNVQIWGQGTCHCGYHRLVTYDPGSDTFVCTCQSFEYLFPIQVLGFVESLVAPVPPRSLMAGMN